VDVGLDIASTWEALERAERTDIVRIGVGVGWHPHQGRAPVAEELEELAALCRHPRAVAVGEIGLDHHFTEWHQAPAEVQRSALRVMLQLARDAGLPVIIHSRETDAEMLEALSDFPGLHGVMHCFLGDIDHARACLDLGYSLSLAGPLTYPRSEALREVARSVPLERLLVETDSPFLPPQSRRGRRNEPAMVAETVARLARERGIPEAEARAVTGANSLRLFPRLIG
jgi:TatD DNase family protein